MTEAAGPPAPGRREVPFWAVLALPALACLLSRLPDRPEVASLAAALGTVLLTAALGARLWGRTAGLAAGAVLASSWYFPQAARESPRFASLTFLVVAAVALLRVAAERETLRQRRGLLLAAYACCALGMAAGGGPLGLALPLLIAGSWLAWEGRPFAFVGLLPLSGTAVAVLLAALWHFLAWLGGGPGAAELWAGVSHGQWDRYFHSTDSLGHPWKYVSEFLPLGMLPWTLLLPAGLAAFWRFGRRPAEPGRAAEPTELSFPMVWAGAVVGLMSGAGQAGVWPWIVLGAALLTLLVVLFMLGRERHWKWIALGLFAAFVSLIGWLPAGGGAPGGTRRPEYVLAAYPALALAAGWVVDRLGRPEAAGTWARRLALAVPWTAALAMLAVTGAALAELVRPGASPLTSLSGGTDPSRPLLAAVAAVGLCGGTASAAMAARGRLAGAVMAVALAASTLTGCWRWQAEHGAPAKAVDRP